MECIEPNCCGGMFPLIAFFLIPLFIFGLWMCIIELAGLWFMFVKADEPGWAAIIPVYNCLIAIKIAGKPWWFFLLMLIPLVNLVIYIIILHGLSKNFGKTGGFTLGLFFFRFIFIPILGFGKAQYVGDKSAFDA